jgi:large subunit ribosomal protein L3
MSGHFQKSGGEGYYHIREFRVEDPQQYEVGQQLNPQEIFNVGDVVDVQGVSKGRGFQGVMKRHGFAGGSAGHGSGFYRAPGSIGCSAYPGRVMKGKKMAGRMGNDTVLKKNVLVIDVREEDSAILVKGPVPGANNGLIQIFTK